VGNTWLVENGSQVGRTGPNGWLRESEEDKGHLGRASVYATKIGRNANIIPFLFSPPSHGLGLYALQI